MHYLEWGDSGGVPLIWSHGYAHTGFEFVNVGAQLADMGYHVYAISYRGHGRTRVDDYEFSLSHIADDISKMMDTLGITQAVVGGLSLGGGVTTEFYDLYPDRALALVLEDGGADPVQARTERLFAVRTLHRDDDQRVSEWVFESRFAAFQAVANLYLPGWGGEMPASVGPLFQSWIREGENGTFFPHYDGSKLLGEGPATSDPARSNELPLLAQSWRRVHPVITYRNLDIPMLIINPTGDSFDPGDGYETLRAMHSDLVKVVDYPGTPHAAHLIRSDWFLRDLQLLLEEITGPVRGLSPVSE